MEEGLITFSLEWWLLFAATLAFFILANTLGFVRGRKKGRDPEESTLAGAVVGAILGLLGLMLAFSFSIAEQRYEERRQLVVEEANAITTAYIRAQMLPDEEEERVREALREYVDIRLAAVDPEGFELMFDKSSEIHFDLWTVAIEMGESTPRSQPVGLFIESINTLIDLQSQRVHVVHYQRLPVGLILTLYLIAILAMVALGYNSGLSHSRSLVPRAIVVISIAVVILLIIDLDQPYQRLFDVNQEVLVNVKEEM